MRVCATLLAAVFGLALLGVDRAVSAELHPLRAPGAAEQAALDALSIE